MNSVTIASAKNLVPAGAELIRPPTKKELAASITLLFDSFSATQRDAPERVAAAYVLALSEYSAWSIREGIRRLVHGEFPEHVNRDWLPSTSIVCRCIRSVAENGPEARERLWRQRLASWRAGEAWNPHWCQGPEEAAFPFLCPKHLVDDFAEATAERKARGRK